MQKPYGTASSLILGVFDRHLHSLSVCIKNSVLLTFIVAALAIHSSARHCVASPIYNQFTGAFGLAVLTPVCSNDAELIYRVCHLGLSEVEET